ncbi:MAG: sycE [Chlamydiales bacterium]|jgi:hypothetical protein|nr:sycE [Chlamydiales bacterium]
MSRLADYVAQLSRKLELDGRITEEQNVFRLKLEEGLAISVQELNPGPGLHFACPVAPYPTGNAEATLVEIMGGNLFGQGTGDATLALDAKEEFIYLLLTKQDQLNYYEFYEQLESFTNYARFWKKRIETLSQVER